MSDERRERGEGVQSRSMAQSPAERAADSAWIKAKTAALQEGRMDDYHQLDSRRAARDEMAAELEAHAEVIDAHEARLDAQDALLHALRTGIAAAFEEPGKQVPDELTSEPAQERPQLRIIQGGAA